MHHGRSALLGLVLFGTSTAQAETIFQIGHKPHDDENIIFKLPRLTYSCVSVPGGHGRGKTASGVHDSRREQPRNRKGSDSEKTRGRSRFNDCPDATNESDSNQGL